MNCGKSRREECSEECAGGNTEEELEEYVEIFEKLEQYRNDAKKYRPIRKKQVSDFNTDTDEETNIDTDDEEEEEGGNDKDDDDDEEEEEEEKEESGTLKTLQNKAKNLLNIKRPNEKSRRHD